MSYQFIVFPEPLDAKCELRLDDNGLVILGVPAVHPTGRQGQGFTIPDGTPDGHGAGWTTTPKLPKVPIYLHGTLELKQPLCSFDVDTVVCPQKPASSPLPLEALHLQGRHGFHTPSGRHVPLTSVTGFKLVQLVATGQQDAARAFLAAIKPARCVRVLVMAKHLFELQPAAGLAALPATLALAQECGRYLSVVALADTKSYSMDFEAHIRTVGEACSKSPACAFVELGNELSPLHSTQDGRLDDLAYLKRLRALIPASVAVSLGSTHNGEDESDIFKDGDLLTVHSSRDDGDDGWRWVRHSNEMRALADRSVTPVLPLGKYVVNDEPRRDDLAPDKHLGLALLCRMFRLADTWHSLSGLQCQPPAGAELLAFEARARGWAAIPDQWLGQYYNAGFTGSPVKSFDGAVRVYSSVSGGTAYTLVLGASTGLRIDWGEDWPTRTRVIAEGGCQLWAVNR